MSELLVVPPGLLREKVRRLLVRNFYTVLEIIYEARIRRDLFVTVTFEKKITRLIIVIR